MSVFEKGTVTVVALAALLALVSIPLALRKVPPNVVYGYRTRATLSNERIWYVANAYFGRAQLIASILSIAAIAILHSMHTISPYAFLNVSVAVVIVPTALAVALTQRYIRSLT
ncbi:MAG TPA: SdpI family protein [Thermoanaerobaculia bacterium]|nr:SdpI family protein [Thermoanaerobaculia bacterium]